MEYKTIIDSNGYITNMCVIYKDRKVQDYEMKENEKIVDYYVVKGYVKPCWNGQEWIEGATEEEIKEWEENKAIEKTEENLIDKLILDNINMQTQIDSLIQASLGGN